MPTNLSPDFVKELIVVQKTLVRFLKEFKALDKSSPDYKKYASKIGQIKDLYVELQMMNLKDLLTETSDVVAISTDEPKGDAEPKTKKEKRKARREKRKSARKEKRETRRAKRKAKKVERKKQKNDKSGAKEESQHRFDSLMEVWNRVQFDKINSDFRAYLDQGEGFLEDAQAFINYAEVFAPGQFDDEIDKAKEMIDKAQNFINVARNISKQAERYAKIVKEVILVIDGLPRKIEDFKDGAIAEATKMFAIAKNFIKTATLDDEDIQLKVENLQDLLAKGQDKLSIAEGLVSEFLKDTDGDNLPDWYNKLEKEYNAIFDGKTDLIPGTKIDDKILARITGLKKSIDKFVAAAVDKVEALDLQTKIQNVKQWMGELSKFTTAITGFVDHIEEGDLHGIYSDLKDFKSFLDSDKDILQGTDIDDDIKKKLQEYSKKAESWLMNTLTDGDPEKEKEVKEILGHLDTLILSTGGVVDHSSKYEEDEDKINIPEITDVSAKEMEDVLRSHGITKKGASVEGILSDMKDQADDLKVKVGGKFKKAAERGSQASDSFRDAKEEYDQAVKKHNDYFKSTNALGKKIINGLLSVAGLAINSFAPGAGTAITTVGAALLGNFDSLNNEIDKIMPEGLEFIGDLAKDLLPGVLPKWGSDRGVIQIEGKELLQGLNDLYANGIASRYREVIALLNGMKAKATNLGKNLRAVEQFEPEGESEETVAKYKKDLEAIQKQVVILDMKWMALKKDILAKYVNLPYPPINKKKAYRHASRYLYSVWLIRFPQKEIRIGKSMIKQFEKFGIMKDSGAEWDTGFWAGLGRGFFGFFGGDPFDYRAELKKMKNWANSENSKLKSAKAWAVVF